MGKAITFIKKAVMILKKNMLLLKQFYIFVGRMASVGKEKEKWEFWIGTGVTVGSKSPQDNIYS